MRCATKEGQARRLQKYDHGVLDHTKAKEMAEYKNQNTATQYYWGVYHTWTSNS